MPTGVTSGAGREAAGSRDEAGRLPRFLARLGFRALLALPPALLLRIAGQAPRVVDGRRLDPRIQFHAWFVRRLRKPLTISAVELRKPRILSLYLLDGRAAPVDVKERTIAGAACPLRIRIYKPRDVAGPLPVLVYFHFGGCVLGDLDTCHTTCSRLAEEARVLVISAQYRLAPEHKFPAAVEDAVTAYRWAHAHAAELGGDPQRIGVGGDSAGGYLAAAVCLDSRDGAGPAPVLQLLIYPVTDMDRTSMPEGPHDDDYPLSRADMIWFSEQYLATSSEAEHPLCSISRATSFRGLPPAIICLAGHDVLREEGIALARRFEIEEVPVVLRIFDSLPHAFTAMCGAIPDAREAVSEIARLLRAAFSHPPQKGDQNAE